MKSFDDIERMILEHIGDIDHKVKYTARTSDEYAELFRAKSMALQSLVELKDSKDGRR